MLEKPSIIGDQLSVNDFQKPYLFLQPKDLTAIAGRGVGKSTLIGLIIWLIIKLAPRTVNVILTRTYADAVSITLREVFGFLLSVGLKRDRDYVYGTKPKKELGFSESFTPPPEYHRCITFRNGTSFILVSQEDKNNGRGLSIFHCINDEALKTDKDHVDTVINAAMRGYKNKMKGNHLMNGFSFLSSMPPGPESRWLLDHGNYYQEEFNIDIFSIWNQIVDLQLKVIDLEPDQIKEYRELTLEIKRLKTKIAPKFSKDGRLFMLSNAFDNLINVGLGYFKRGKAKTPFATFLIEYMNYLMQSGEDTFYPLEARHTYAAYYNNDYVQSIEGDIIKDAKKMDCRWTADCIPNKRLHLCFDLGANSFMWVYQYHYHLTHREIRMINCFHVINPKMINDMIDEFSKFYEPHKERNLFVTLDKHGNTKLGNTPTTYNQDILNALSKLNWKVTTRKYKYQEIPYHMKHSLIKNVFAELDLRTYPVIRMNVDRCKDGIISLRDAKVKDVNGKVEKDKSSEKLDSGVKQEHATHYSDAFDKGVWTAFHHAENSHGILI